MTGRTTGTAEGDARLRLVRGPGGNGGAGRNPITRTRRGPACWPFARTRSRAGVAARAAVAAFALAGAAASPGQEPAAAGPPAAAGRTITVQNLAPFPRREIAAAVVPFARGTVAALPDLHA